MTTANAEHEVLRALRGLRFGTVEIQVHEGRIVQIERRERVRLDGAGRPPVHRRREHGDSVLADHAREGRTRDEETT